MDGVYYDDCLIQVSESGAIILVNGTVCAKNTNSMSELINLCRRDVILHSGEEELQQASSPHLRRRIIRDLIQENPHICAHYFLLRREALYHNILKPLLKVEDFWDRVEFQGNGSGHQHGLQWLASSTNHELDDSTAMDAFAEFWGRIVDAWNHHPGRPAEPEHPSSWHYSRVTNSTETLAALANGVQVHKCGGVYCMRENRRTKRMECRFKFPKQEHAEPRATKDTNRDFPSFDARRNTPWMNAYVPALMLAWRANIDFSPCTTVHAVV